MEIYLIRHTTPLVPQGQIYGWSEIPLAATFGDEIQTVIKNLPAKPDKVYTSPSLRCVELAKHISAEYAVDARLKEFNFGEWEGKTWDTVDQVALQCWMDDYVNVCVPGGESMVQMKSRLDAFWDVLKKERSEKIAIVTHGGVIRILLALHHLTPLKDCFDYKVNFGEIFTLNY